jgi:small subunit ribosomal protein S17
MADQTPENEEAVEVVESAEASADAAPEPDVTAEATPAEPGEAAAPAPEAAPPAPSATPLTPKERKAAGRAQRGRRRGATPEERTEIRAKKAVERRRRRLQEREKARAARAEAGPAQTPPSAGGGDGAPKVRLGKVVSSKADKTITVRIDVARRHRKYQKIVRSSSTLHAHDEANDANEGDLVHVVEARPLSRTKRWRLVEVLERAK